MSQTLIASQGTWRKTNIKKDALLQGFAKLFHLAQCTSGSLQLHRHHDGNHNHGMHIPVGEDQRILRLIEPQISREYFIFVNQNRQIAQLHSKSESREIFE